MARHLYNTCVVNRVVKMTSLPHAGAAARGLVSAVHEMRLPVPGARDRHALGCRRARRGTALSAPLSGPITGVHTRVTSLGGVPREQEMLKGHLPRVLYHRVLVYQDPDDSGIGGADWDQLDAKTRTSLSSEYGAYKAVKARFWPWRSGESP